MKSWLKAVDPPTWMVATPSRAPGSDSQPLQERLRLRALRVVPRNHGEERRAPVVGGLRRAHPRDLRIAAHLARVRPECGAVRVVGHGAVAKLGNHLRGGGRARPDLLRGQLRAHPGRVILGELAQRAVSEVEGERRDREREQDRRRGERREPRPPHDRGGPALPEARAPLRGSGGAGSPASPAHHPRHQAREHRQPAAGIGAPAEQAHERRQERNRRENRDRDHDDRPHRHRADRGGVHEVETGEREDHGDTGERDRQAGGAQRDLARHRRAPRPA